jgi:hypothetical protein
MDGSRVRRAECAVWRRLLEAALIPSSGQSVYITCSRWRRFPAAKARSLTRLAAFLRRQASSSMVRAPTLTSKPPSNLMRTASGFLPVSLLGLCTGSAVLPVMLFGGCLPLCVPSHPLSLHLP